VTRIKIHPRVTSVREEKRQLRAQETQGQMFNPTF
jgi:hypothetical protein